MGNVKFHTMGILWGKLIYSHTMGFEKKPIELKNRYNSPIWKLVSIDFPMYGNIFSQFMEDNGNTHIFPTHGF